MSRSVLIRPLDDGASVHCHLSDQSMRFFGRLVASAAVLEAFSLPLGILDAVELKQVPLLFDLPPVLLEEWHATRFELAPDRLDTLDDIARC